MKTTRNLDSKYVMRDDGIAQQVCTNYANCAAGRKDCIWSPHGSKGPKQLKTQNLTLKSAVTESVPNPSGGPPLISYVCDFGGKSVTVKDFSTEPSSQTIHPCGVGWDKIVYAPLPTVKSSACVSGPGYPCLDPGNYPCYNALVANGIIADPNSDPNSGPAPNSNQFDQVCNGYANIVNDISKNPAGLPELTKSGDKWSSCYASTAGLGKLNKAGGTDPTETTNCEFQNANVIFYAEPDDEPEQAFPPCSGTSPLGPPVPYVSDLPPNDAACYNVLKNAGCITSSPEPGPAPGPAPGKLGGKCKEEGKKCDGKLICKRNKCRRPSPSPPPGPSPNPSPGPSPPPGPSPDSEGLSTPAVVGISVGGVVLLIGIIFGIIYLAKKKKKGRK